METIRVETNESVCRITLSRPERLNALGDRVRAELQETLDRLADDTATRVVVLSGEGRAFSAGADLKEPAVLPEGWAARRHAAGAWQRLLDRLETIPPVTVASVHGAVIGGAALLAAACDVRIAADDLRVSIPEVAIGIPLSWAGLPRLVREIGLPRTRDLVMTGRVLSADEALAWGFVTRLVPAAELGAATDRLVSELLEMPQAPLAMTRDALGAIGRSGGSFAAAWADPDLIAWSLLEPEGREAAMRYVERRLSGRDRTRK